MYPVADANFNMNVDKAVSLLANGMQMVLDRNVPDHEDRQKALVSPLYASLDKIRDLYTQ